MSESQSIDIAILMATYNGERFLGEQMESICRQSYTRWHLYVHDDGSTDQTRDILKTYANRYPRQITILDYTPQKGAFSNFMSLLRRVESPYYMFCDQDDIWHTDKIERSVKALTGMEERHSGKPLIVHSDLRIVDENGKLLSPSFWAAAGIYPEMFRTSGHRISNVVTGCTMLFNDAARQAALRRSPAGTPLHDEWVTICSCAQGGVVLPLSESLIDYRQHGSNTLGAEACYQKKTLHDYLTSLKTIYRENIDNYRTLRSAGYGSFPTYLKNKVRNMVVYHLKYKRT